MFILLEKTYDYNTDLVSLSGAHTLPSHPHACTLRVQARTFTVPVQDVQSCNEELVGILLLVACQVPGMSPHQVQQLVRDVGRPVPRVKLLREKANKIACQD